MPSASTFICDPAYAEIAHGFRSERSQRLGNSKINPNDFRAIADAGYLGLSVPVEMGGNWHNLKRTGPVLAEAVRALARGDSSVALVAAMHPSVLAFWHAGIDGNPLTALTDQAQRYLATALDGHW